MTKRLVALVGLLALVSMSGCMGLLTGEALVFEAEPAVVPNSSAADSGFTLEQYNETKLNETVSVAGIERDVRISFHRAIYREQTPPGVTGTNVSDIDRSTVGNESQLNESLRPTVVSIVSLPDAKVLGQSVNPLVRLPSEQIITRFGQSDEGKLTGLEKQSERRIQFLGNETLLSTFNATAEGDNESRPARVSITKVSHEGDVVMLVAITPEGGSDDTEKLDEFISKVEHPAEAPN